MNRAYLIKPLITAFTILILLGCTAEETLSPQAETPEAATLSTLRPTTTEIPRINPDTTTPVSITADQATSITSTSEAALSTVAATPEWPNAENQNIYVPFEYIFLEELVDGQYLMEITWQPGGRFLTYALWSDEKSREPRGWEWWRYDIESQQKQPLPPVESLVSGETRRQLNLCPIDEAQWESETACWRLSYLFESPYSDHIVFQPIPEETGEFSDGELWIAHRDGSNVQKLAEFTPSYVRWSSDGQWFLTGQHFPGLPGEETHYLNSNQVENYRN